MSERLPEIEPWSDEVCESWLDYHVQKAKEMDLESEDAYKIIRKFMPEAVLEYAVRENIFDRLYPDDLSGIHVVHHKRNVIGRIRVDLSDIDSIPYKRPRIVLTEQDIRDAEDSDGGDDSFDWDRPQRPWSHGNDNPDA